MHGKFKQLLQKAYRQLFQKKERADPVIIFVHENIDELPSMWRRGFSKVREGKGKAMTKNACTKAKEQGIAGAW